jgi:hypothetical protein
MPAKLRDMAKSKLWEKLPGTHPKSAGARIKRMLASLHLDAPQRYDSYMRLFEDATVTALLKESRGASPAAKWVVHGFEALADSRDVAQTAMALDRITYLPEDYAPLGVRDVVLAGKTDMNAAGSAFRAKVSAAAIRDVAAAVDAIYRKMEGAMPVAMSRMWRAE